MALKELSLVQWFSRMDGQAKIVENKFIPTLAHNLFRAKKDPYDRRTGPMNFYEKFLDTMWKFVSTRYQSWTGVTQFDSKEPYQLSRSVSTSHLACSHAWNASKGMPWIRRKWEVELKWCYTTKRSRLSEGLGVWVRARRCRVSNWQPFMHERIEPLWGR